MCLYVTYTEVVFYLHKIKISKYVITWNNNNRLNIFLVEPHETNAPSC